MTKPLLDVLFMSEKRKNFLLFLQDGTKEMEDILKSLGTTRQALLPQIKVLQEHCLVSHSKDAYELTAIGELDIKRVLCKGNYSLKWGKDLFEHYLKDSAPISRF